ncbi:MAG: OmpA family protein [Polyangiaceae bacterium]|jgi:chemotaxis protein MotB|nr:OmpA family protein [Polyangiaceae bacterium]
MNQGLWVLMVAFPCLLSGCVSRATHEQALNDARTATEQEKARAEKLAEALEQAELRGASDETRKELEALRAQKARVEQRLRLFEEFVQKFKSMIDAGRLKIVARQGRIVLVMSTDVLFDPGKTEIKKEGEEALAEIAKNLGPVRGRRFQVVGHTDSTPIHKEQFPSNWELSTARALVVVHYLIRRGVRASTLSAAGYGQYDPVAPNTTDDGRAQNRRIEITLVPNIEELIDLPVVESKSSVETAPSDK